MDWIAALAALLGVWCLARQQRIGFVFCLVGNLGWAWYGLHHQIWSLVGINTLVGCINAYGWWHWGTRPNNKA